MLSKRIVANLVVFFALSVGLIGYGFVTLFGNPLADPRTVQTELPDAGGLRTGFSASHDGVIIGTVSAIDLTERGVRVTVELDPGVTVPAGVEARVVRASAVGEQRLDLVTVRPADGRTLADGATVPTGTDPVPPDVADLLETATGLISALPSDDLNTVVHESAAALKGRSEDVKSLTRNLTRISDDIVAGDADLRRLLAAAPPVLDDFADLSPDVHRALDNTEELTRFLADHDQQVVDLLGHTADLATTADGVLLDNRANLTCLGGDLVTLTGTLQGQTLADLDRALRTNQWFFGLIDKVSARGPTRDVGYGPVTPDQVWLRTLLLMPPQTPFASAYRPPRAPLPVKTGRACPVTPFGPAAPATPATPTGAADAAVRAPAGERTNVLPPDATFPAPRRTGPLPAGEQASTRWTLNRLVVPLLILLAGVAVLIGTYGPAARRLWRQHGRGSSTAR